MASADNRPHALRLWVQAFAFMGLFSM